MTITRIIGRVVGHDHPGHVISEIRLRGVQEDEPMENRFTKSLVREMGPDQTHPYIVQGSVGSAVGGVPEIGFIELGKSVGGLWYGHPRVGYRDIT